MPKFGYHAWKSGDVECAIETHHTDNKIDIWVWPKGRSWASESGDTIRFTVTNSDGTSKSFGPRNDYTRVKTFSQGTEALLSVNPIPIGLDLDVTYGYWLNWGITGGILYDYFHFLKIDTNGGSYNGSSSADVNYNGETYPHTWNLSDTATAISKNTTRTGYTLKNWTEFKGYSDNVGKTPCEQLGTVSTTGTVSAKADPVTWTTIKANWEANTYTITLFTNDGSEGSTTRTKTYDTNLNIELVPTHKDGARYRFKGWSRTAVPASTTHATPDYPYENGKAVIDDDLLYSITNKYLYAVWEDVGYEVKYTTIKGTAPESQWKIHDEALTLRSFIADQSETGSAKRINFDLNTGAGTAPADVTTTSTNTYKQINWSDGVNTYSSGGSYTANVAVTLSATWELNRTEYSSVIMPSTSAIKIGHLFDNKWCIDSLGAGTMYNAGQEYDPDEYPELQTSRQLYAMWRPVTYNVQYSANGGAGAPSSQKKTYGVDLTLRSDIPTKTGYTFKGWAQFEDASVPEWSAGGTLSEDLVSIQDANVTLYAVWEKDTYTITYKNATAEPDWPTSYQVDSETITLPVPSKAYNRFNAWHDASGQIIIQISKGSTGNKTVYADFTPLMYVFNDNEWKPAKEVYIYNGGWNKSECAYISTNSGWVKSE